MATWKPVYSSQSPELVGDIYREIYCKEMAKVIVEAAGKSKICRAEHKKGQAGGESGTRIKIPGWDLTYINPSNTRCPELHGGAERTPGPVFGNGKGSEECIPQAGYAGAVDKG